MKRKAIIEALHHRRKDADYNRTHLATSEARFIEEGKFQAYSIALRTLGESVPIDRSEAQAAMKTMGKTETWVAEMPIVQGEAREVMGEDKKPTLAEIIDSQIMEMGDDDDAAEDYRPTVGDLVDQLAEMKEVWRVVREAAKEEMRGEGGFSSWQHLIPSVETRKLIDLALKSEKPFLVALKEIMGDNPPRRPDGALDYDAVWRKMEENPRHPPYVEINDETNTATIKQAAPPAKDGAWATTMHDWQKFSTERADADAEATTPKFIRLYNKDQHVASAPLNENLGAYVTDIANAMTVTGYKLYNGAGICIQEGAFDPVRFAPQGPALPLDAMTIGYDDDDRCNDLWHQMGGDDGFADDDTPDEAPTPATPQVECYGVTFDMRREYDEYKIGHQVYKYVCGYGQTPQEAYDALTTHILRNRRYLNEKITLDDHERAELDFLYNDITIPYPDFPLL